MSAILRKDGTRRNSLTVQLEMPTEVVESFANAVADLPAGIQGMFIRKAVNRFSTALRAAMRDGAKTYTRSGALARSMVKKTIYYPSGTVVVLAGPSRKFRTLYRKPGGTKDQAIVPFRYAHLPEYGTRPRFHKKGRKLIYVPWLKRRIPVPEGSRKLQATGRVRAPRRITISLRSRVPAAMAALSTDVSSEFKKWWAKQAPTITKAKYRPNSIKTIGTDAVDI